MRFILSLRIRCHLHVVEHLPRIAARQKAKRFIRLIHSLFALDLRQKGHVNGAGICGAHAGILQHTKRVIHIARGEQRSCQKVASCRLSKSL